MFNQNQYYRNYRYNNYYGYNNFIPTYYPNKDYNISNNTIEDINDNSDDLDTYDNSQIIETTYNIDELSEEKTTNTKEEIKEEETKTNFDSSSKKQFRLGPLSVCDNSINILGFSIAIDDLIIIGLIILLLFQSETDYIIIIILGLILLNIDFSSLGLF